MRLSHEDEVVRLEREHEEKVLFLLRQLPGQQEASNKVDITSYVGTVLGSRHFLERFGRPRSRSRFRPNGVGSRQNRAASALDTKVFILSFEKKYGNNY